MTQFTIRPPDEKDIETLAELHFYIWHEFYKDIVPKAYADKHFSMEKCLKLQKEIIEATKKIPTKHAIWIAEDTDTHQVAGICYVSPNESAGKYPEIAGFEMEIQRLYIWPQYRGKGLGSRLFELSREWLEKNHYQSTCIWIFDDNPYNQFYRKYGATPANNFLHDFEGKDVALTVLGLEV
jgi:GNAT superfamily N-acetyltransferase